MMQVKGWFVAATILAFMAGGGSGLIVGCVQDTTEAPPAVQDADGYLSVFKTQIGITGDDQYKALEVAYDQYWRDLRELTRTLVSKHREELAQIDRTFLTHVYQVLNTEQRELWIEKTGMAPPVAPGPTDTDTGGEPLGDDPSEDEEKDEDEDEGD